MSKPPRTTLAEFAREVEEARAAAKPQGPDLSTGTVALGVNNTRIHECRVCKAGIHIGWAEVVHTPTATSHVRNYYHPDCVEIP